jgi:hypothetical protein
LSDDDGEGRGTEEKELRRRRTEPTGGFDRGDRRTDASVAKMKTTFW